MYGYPYVSSKSTKTLATVPDARSRLMQVSSASSLDTTSDKQNSIYLVSSKVEHMIDKRVIEDRYLYQVPY